eukprot:NODE_166_length_1318_cov_134.758077_g133_i0.p1 GENE.NODE_166_length_1318_cov_134.758077_g133_i0~~NODE_166_length_1318_cov_134.758077_g133_i0.p1  ORF type:complete len:388 (-),score=90.88 NODE_166_length_1318_cov_134.758077_g133_i0:92-1255(-)
MRLILLFLVFVGSSAKWADLFKFPWTGIPLSLMTGISCPNSTTCYVAGSTGSSAFSIYYSNDMFKTFNPCTMDTTGLLLLDMAMGSDTHGVAGGVGALKVPGLLHTADGMEWKGAIDLVLVDGQDVQAISASTYAFVGSPNALLGQNGVAWSTNAGLTWKSKVWAKDLKVPTGAGARYGAFPSATTWYVTGGSFPSNNSAGLYSYSAHLKVDRKTGKFQRVLRDPNVPADGTYTACITKTTDGGSTWEVQVSDTGNFYFNGVDCFDVNTCMAVGEGFADGASPGARVYGTTDGKTWTQLTMLTGPEQSLMRVKMLSASEAWAIGGQAKSQLNMTGTFFHTIDSGKTWTMETVHGTADILGMTWIGTTEAYVTGLVEDERTTIIHYTK